MSTIPDTETVVRNHLQAFVQRRGVAAILQDYDDGARLHSEARVYRGKAEIGEFFEEFIASLPDDAIDAFSLRSLRIDGDVAYITWTAGSAIALGTDTFVVEHGRIVTQTVAMCVARA